MMTATLPQATLIYLIVGPDPKDFKNSHVLLGRKKRGLGRGFINAPGGKLKQGEEIAACAVRELAEETGIEFDDLFESDQHPGMLDRAALVRFRWPANPKNDMDVHVFVCRITTRNVPGISEKALPTIVETPEFRPVWIKGADVDLREMWRSDAYWLPAVLDGREINALIEFESKGEYPSRVVLEQPHPDRLMSVADVAQDLPK